ncbi:factor required for KinB signal transduction and activation of the phosphorelay to sporulation [Bacillus altitudinis]|uniref:Factor required for KinB signal transduction and activation of the phosphorelay to sporulation n=1 Tax=Bacillus altitudinis TaxID=293387 RepID=A0A653VNC4_BACAB|nr:kinase-associated lipoprotein B [Bacillus altitudinis]VXC07598.1 factor required for KinB signal transduction and activation of the phosphorelay to sporulation [Bacillus altitudinis]
MTDIQIGQIVKGFYKTGVYIGEVTAVKPSTYLVQVKAVLTHPTQGDLHHPKEADVPLRALAFREQTNIPHHMVKPYDGDIPDYQVSLKDAVDKLKKGLSADDSKWAEKSRACLSSLEKDYFPEDAR